MGSFLPTPLFKLRGLDFYPGGTSTHWFMPAFAGRTHFGTNRHSMRRNYFVDSLPNKMGGPSENSKVGLPCLRAIAGEIYPFLSALIGSILLAASAGR
jgi:hypothetical protein